ncbi:MAG TPA: hypothetical protein VFJ68_10805 [Casimicrobiaceae bacterium]|nr:hypothetical protein [Casimicrobiaceae bacterium]
MTISRAWLALALSLIAASAAAETGIVTLAEGGARLLRGTTWYKLVVGARIEEADIIEAPDRSQTQIELASGSRMNLVGGGKIYLVPATAKGAPIVVMLPMGWLKAAGKAPGVRVRTAPFDLAVGDGVLVVHANGPAVEFFVESGSARLIELTANGADGAARDLKSGEYASKAATGSIATGQRPPKAFVEAMPRHFADALPTLADRIKAKPTLVVDHEITYAEAEPWLAGRDRAAFEKRFASRLRDPAFRSAALPNLARYPMWDRMLNPEKYAPKDKSAPKGEAVK